MAIIKEYQSNQIDMRGPGAWNAKPVETSKTCILRFDDGQKLSLSGLAALFNIAAQEHSDTAPKTSRFFEGHHVKVSEDRVEFSCYEFSGAELEKMGYKRLPPKTIAARG